MEQRILTDLSLLDGTEYFELLPGKYKGVCWNNGSLFIDALYWSDFLDFVITKHVSAYDYYEFTYLYPNECISIAAELSKLSISISQVENFEDLQRIRNIHYFSEEFNKNFALEKSFLSKFYLIISQWLNEQGQSDGATILGM